jgi:hypothetical protein
MKNGIQVFSEEQDRQTTHGYGPDHDDLHVEGEIAAGAACYATANTLLLKHHTIEEVRDLLLPCWPFEPETWKPSADLQTNLRKAGGMLASEYDRLNRLQPLPEKAPMPSELAFLQASTAADLSGGA